MDDPAGYPRALRLGRDGATALLAGALLSGIISQTLIAGLHPSPPWQGARDFAAHYRAVEALPYFYGIALVAGSVMVIVACHRIASAAEKHRTTIALVLMAAFVSLVGFNYIAQITFVPELARHYDPGNDAILAALSMGNPRSLGWALELWGYGLFGLASWLVAPLFNRDRLERVAGRLLVLNGVLGVAGALFAAVNIGWVITTAGLVSYVAWNIVIVAAAFALVWVFHRRLTASPALPNRSAP